MTDQRRLDETYDTAVLDLDGVVYIGGHAVEGAVPALSAARESGMHLAFVTNNASRPPGAVVEHLVSLGIQAEAGDVVTSAQAAARLLADQVDAGSPVYVLGGVGLEEALRERGLVPVTGTDPEPVAVAQGYGPEMPWRQVITGALLVKEGLPWVASNTDLTVPTARGAGPGNGTLVKLVADFAGRQPVVAGKPMPPLFVETLDRVGGEKPLVIGDRIDTDIDGARAMDWDSLLVMTGVTDLGDLAEVAAESRPTFVAADLGRLALPVALDHDWSAEVRDGRLRVDGSGSVHAWWQTVAAALWAHLDQAGEPADVTGVEPGSVAP